MTRLAILAMGTPIALATKGTVRDARGLTSMRYTSPSLTANWMFISPLTDKACASATVCRSISAIVSGVSE